MKDKILYLILGILIGAVITAGCFLAFSKNNSNGHQMNDRGEFAPENFDSNMTPPEMRGGKNGEKSDNSIVPEKPSGDMNSNSVENQTSNT